MRSNSYRFDISEFTTQPGSFDEDVSRHARLGAGTIEGVEAKLDDSRYGEQMASIGAAGLGISGVQSKVRSFFASRLTPDPLSLDERCAALRGSLERFRRFAPGVREGTLWLYYSRNDRELRRATIRRRRK